jgi:hypothetical protein
MRPSERTRGTDAEVALLAEGQHGVVAHRQLVALGFSSESIKRRVSGGRLHRLHQGVYAVGHMALTQRSRWMAAVLAGGQEAVLSYWSAAALWGIRDHRGGPIHVTSPRKTKSRGAIRRHCMRLPSDEVTVEDGISVTTVPRTIFDLAAVASPQTVESAMRQSEYLRLYDSLSLWDLLDRYPGHRGVRAIRTALGRFGETSGAPRSTFEERFLAFLDRYALPRPELNVWLRIGGREIQVDCLWPAQREIVELDGWQAHGTRTAFRDDKARDRALRVAGYSITRIAWSQLDDEPEAIARDLRALLA